jgi:hypothetical protein
MALTSCRKAMCTAWIASALLGYPLAVGASTISFEADGGGRTVASATGGLFWRPSDPIIFGPFASFALWTPAGTAVQNADGSWDFSFPSGILALSDVEGGANSFTYPVSASDIGVVPSLVGVLPVLPFSFSLTPPHDDSTWDLWSPPRPVASLVNSIELTLGPGTLRSDIAAVLGIHPETLGGKGTWIVDDWLHNPTASDCTFDDALGADESLHCGINNNAGVVLTVQDVPEPISLGLIGVGIAAFAARRRARR